MRHLKSKNPKLLSLFIFMLVSFALGIGSVNERFSVWHIFTWLKPIWPGFNSIRVPPRFWLGGFFSLIIFSAIGFSQVNQIISPKLLLVFGILPLLVTATVNLSKTTLLATQTQWATPRSYHYNWEHAWGKETEMYSLIRQGKGVIKCLPNIAVYESLDLSEGNSLKITAPIGTSASLSWLSWNRIKIEASRAPKEPFTLRLNLNSSPFWNFKGEGKVSYAPSQLLTLQTSSGNLTGELFFEQPWVKESVFLSVCGWLFVLAFFLVYRS
jgi:hypothetical protein